MSEDYKTWMTNYQDEIDSAYLYDEIAAMQKSEPLAEVYRKMAASEKKHASFWQEKMTAAGKPGKPVPTIRAKILRQVARVFGVDSVLQILIGGEKNGCQAYYNPDDAMMMEMSGEEASHERLIKQMAAGPKPEGATGGQIMSLEGRHKSSGGNALRAAVLGANDGLVSNMSLVMGVAGAEMAGQGILITGLAGLLAGAASMALGEWLSVQSSRELYQHQIDIEKAEIANAPEEEAEELALIYQAKGLSEAQAKELAEKIMSDPNTTVDTLAREELGINPEELGGSAWEAAITSFVLFAIGAIIPVAPFIFWSGMTAVVLSLSFSAVGLFVIGALITLMTGKNVLQSGFRQVVFGLAAAGLTYGIGKLIGVSLAG